VAVPILVGGSAMSLGWYSIAALFLASGVALGLFFRDPGRESPPAPWRVVCPADGRVVGITEVEEPDYLRMKSRRISIFMSLFNVHTNYAPITGRVEFLKHQRGSFYRAYLPEASMNNENNSIGIRGENYQVMVRQIAGTIARRIVCRVKENDFVQAGQKIGLIKFGSRVDVFVPIDWEVLVKEGDRVKGGISQIAGAK